MIGRAVALIALLSWPLAAQDRPPGKLSNDGVVRASAMVDSVFIDRRLTHGAITGGDWASYLLARLGTGPIPDTLGIEVSVDTARIEVSGRLDDLPAEARQLLGPLASMVDPGTPIVADVALERTGPRVARFWLRGLQVNGISFPEFLLAQMMAQVGRQYPALTKSGRDLYVEVPADGVISLGDGTVVLAVPGKPAGDGGGASPPGTARP